MNPLCARGEGKPPCYVDWIEPWLGKEVIRLAGRGALRRPFILCSSDADVRRRCSELAARRVLFSVGDHAGWGPAEIVEQWQDEGLILLSFLRIAWAGPQEWQVHEMAPGTQEWEIVSLDEILASRPIRLPGGTREPSE